MPLHIMCMKPNSVDTKLFTDRDREYSDIKGKIGMFLDNREEERRKLMIYGERGVGKSILVRKVLKDISEERSVITITIDGDEARSPEDLLRDICKKLAYELNKYYTKKQHKNEKLFSEIAFLDFISYAQVLKDNDVTTIVERIEGQLEGGIGLLEILSLRSRITAREGKDRSRSQEIEHAINSRFLTRLLESVTQKVHEFTDILIYIDNLDQLENKDSIDDFVTEIIKLKKSIIVASMRREVADKNIGRDFKEVQFIEPMTSDGLEMVLLKRLEYCDRKQDLENTQLMEISKLLRDCTGNPLSFLTWLHYLIVNAELDKSNIVDQLKGFTKAHYSTFDETIIKNIAKRYMKYDLEFISREKIIKDPDIDEDLFDMLIDFGVIIPDNKYIPHLYKISSDFMFYKLDT